MPRYFTHRYSGSIQLVGVSTHNHYWFAYGAVTQVDNNTDAEYFLHLGTPETGVYPLRETDAAGNPIGPFPPIDLTQREAIIDTRRFPSDRGLPDAKEWREISEDLADPVLYYYYIRERRRG